MKTIFSLLIILIYCVGTAAQTSTNYNANPNYLDIVNIGPASIYPSEIVIAGAQPYLKNIRVNFPVFYMDGDYNELNLMLESPNGTRVILMSDCQCGQSSFVPHDFGFSSYSVKNLQGTAIASSTYYRPINLGTEPDSFPAPGPGLIPMGEASFIPLMNENPNGIWKLWIVCENETSWSFFSLSQGWDLTIETSAVPVCLPPEPPKVLELTDNTALITWKGNGSATKWDIDIKALDPNSNFGLPILDWGSDTILVQNLTPGKRYETYIRSACADSSRSNWIGPIDFKTLFTPCLYPNPLILDQEVDIDTIGQFSDFQLQGVCGSGSPNVIFRFVPPDTGAYWLDIKTIFSGYAAAYWLPDTSAQCPKEGWSCFGPQNGPWVPRFLDTLTGGIPYFLMFETSIPLVFQLTRCPSLHLTTQQDGPIEPFTATLHMLQDAVDFSGMFEVWYTADSTMAGPGHNTPPSETAMVLTNSDEGIYHLQTDSLIPSTKYRVWVRSFCENGTQNTAWSGPFSFITGTFCGAPDSVWFDQITDNTVRLNFIAPSNAAFRYELRVNGNKLFNYYGAPYQLLPDSAGQLVVETLHLLQPDTTYEFYLKGYCYPLGFENPWYGPFTFRTKPGCFMPVRDIQCGESVSGMRFDVDSLNAFQSTECMSTGYTQNVNEALFRITASLTGDMEIYGYGGVFSLASYWYKDAALGCSKYGFTYIDCENVHSSVTFPVEAGHTYYLLVDENLWPGYTDETDFSFVVFGCAPPCPSVDSIWLDASSATSATLRWLDVAPGSDYLFSYKQEYADSAKTIVTTDTTITITGLEPTEKYRFWVGTYCLGGQPSSGNDFVYQLGDHYVELNAALSRCSPRFVLPGDSVSVNYGLVEIKVPEDGDYRLISKERNMLIYKNSFDPENSEDNLMADKKVRPFASRTDTVLHLLATNTYFLVSCNWRQYPFLEFFNGSAHVLSVLVDGPAPAQLTESPVNTVEPGPHGHVPLTGAFGQTGTCRDTSGWVHFYKIADDPTDMDGDALLISLKTNVDANVLSQLPLAFVAHPSVAKITNPPAPFVQNPDGWYEMNRFWFMENIQPAQQIDEDFSLRFYYTEADFGRMQDAIESAGGNLGTHEALYFHKINGYHHFDAISPGSGHAGIPAATAYDAIGYWPYSNEMVAGMDTWRHGTFAGEHYAETIIHGFSGGGGGASVNGNGVFNPVSGTKEAFGLPGMQLFPNPNKGLFTVALAEPLKESCILKIIDVAGRTVYTQQLAFGSGACTVNAENFYPGFYLLQIASVEKVLMVQKFVKQ